jgi:hypothetical protein
MGVWRVSHRPALKTAKFLLIAHGSQDEVTRAREILRATPAAELGVHAGDPLVRAGAVGPEPQDPHDHEPGRDINTLHGRRTRTMATIVEYIDQKPPENRYPHRIISPLRSGACCFSDMEQLGAPQEDERSVFQYRRCRQCGFAVRVILREIPDAALMASLRESLAHAFVRNVA